MPPSVLALYIGTMIYRLVLIGGCAWLVSERDWSAWWFVVALYAAFEVDFEYQTEKRDGEQDEQSQVQGEESPKDTRRREE